MSRCLKEELHERYDVTAEDRQIGNKKNGTEEES